jgi:hypothetical protein
VELGIALQLRGSGVFRYGAQLGVGTKRSSKAPARSLRTSGVNRNAEAIDENASKAPARTRSLSGIFWRAPVAHAE